MKNVTPGKKTRKDGRRQGARPPVARKGVKEWPVDDKAMDLLADAALNDDLDVDESLVDGGVEGAYEAVSKVRKRAGQLAHVPTARDALSFRRRRTFLMALSQTLNVTAAAAAAGWSRSAAYGIRAGDEEFKKQWEAAIETAADHLELEAFRRAVHGVQEDVYGSMGKDMGTGVVGQKTVYSDGLLTTLLKAHRREKFSERHVVKDETDRPRSVLVMPAKYDSPEEWAAAAEKNQREFREKREDDE